MINLTDNNVVHGENIANSLSASNRSFIDNFNDEFLGTGFGTISKDCPLILI